MWDEFSSAGMSTSGALRSYETDIICDVEGV